MINKVFNKFTSGYHYIVLLGILFCTFSANGQDRRFLIPSFHVFTEDSTCMKQHPKLTQLPVIAQPPFTVIQSLFKYGLIEEPYQNDNVEHVQWISKTPWVFEAHFSIDARIRNAHFLYLNIENIDTYADIFLNEQYLGSSSNTFLPFRISIKGNLKNKNTLRIEMKPPLAFTEEIWKEVSYLPGDQRNLIRKPAFQFGWDWAPRTITVGITQSVFISYSNHIDIKKNTITHHYDIEKQIGTIHQDLEFEYLGASNITVKHVVRRSPAYMRPLYQSESEELKASLFHAMNNEIKLTHPPTYNFFSDRAHVILETSFIRENKVIYTLQDTIYFDLNDLERTEDARGESFYFTHKKTKVFAKGVNWVPLDNIYDRVTNSDYRKALTLISEAGFNMIRVWGGGQYEREIFYNLCDSLGIMVWQDFMFTGGLYPGNKEFIENVKKEAIHQLQRLSKHPCIVLWCGNNEMNEGWHNWGWQSKMSRAQKILTWSDYQRIFNDILPQLVKKYAPHIPYFESSPLYGRGDVKYVDYGDAHDWFVWHDLYPFTQFANNPPRFMSEYGFQSFPSLSLLETYIDEPITLRNDNLQYHQKSKKGQKIIDEYLDRWFDKPKNIASYVYLSQLMQAHGIAMGMQAHRANKKSCGGSLIWQFNDSWPAISWSMVDYYSIPKALYYQAKKDFRIISVTKSLRNKKPIFHIVSDYMEPMEVQLHVKTLNLSNGKIVFEEISNFEVPNNSTRIIDIPELYLKKYQKNHLILIDTKWNGESFRQEFLMHHNYDEIDLNIPLVVIKNKRVEDHYEIEISSSDVALWTMIQSDIPGYFSENLFTLLPGETRKVTFFPYDSNKAATFTSMSYSNTLFP